MRFKHVPNGLRKPFHEKSQNVWETDYEFRFRTLRNGIRNPFSIHFDFFGCTPVHNKITLCFWWCWDAVSHLS